MAAMISRSTTSSVPLGEYVPTADRRIVLRGVTWDGFDALITVRGELRPRMAYLDGAVEIMSPSRGHETIKSCLGHLIAEFCLEGDIPFSAYGSWLLEDRSDQAGAEPDDCYVFSRDPKSKDRPDLVVEVVWTSGGLDKLEIYRRLAIGEVWIWKADAISVHVLGASGYEPRPTSECLPHLDLSLICQLAQIEPMSEAVKQLRELLRRGRS
jgi:Uma2 family endonuclease